MLSSNQRPKLNPGDPRKLVLALNRCFRPYVAGNADAAAAGMAATTHTSPTNTEG